MVIRLGSRLLALGLGLRLSLETGNRLEHLVVLLTQLLLELGELADRLLDFS
jgi:hypothetical protein